MGRRLGVWVGVQVCVRVRVCVARETSPPSPPPPPASLPVLGRVRAGPEPEDQPRRDGTGPGTCRPHGQEALTLSDVWNWWPHRSACPLQRERESDSRLLLVVKLYNLPNSCGQWSYPCILYIVNKSIRQRNLAVRLWMCVVVCPHHAVCVARWRHVSTFPCVWWLLTRGVFIALYTSFKLHHFYLELL